jgi:6-phosphofructokinase 2
MAHGLLRKYTIATITLNPCLDKYISVSHLEMNETIRSQAVIQYAGGKGLDVSRAVHEMGGETMAFGFAGGNEGVTLTNLLAKEGVPFSFVTINNETRSCYIIGETDSTQQIRISTPGPGVSTEQVNELIERVWAMQPVPNILVCGGSVPPGLPADVYAVIIHKAREHGIKTILDSSNIYLKEGIKARPFLIKPNEREAEELLGRPLATKKDIIGAVGEMVRMGVEIAVISLGKDGLVAADRSEIVKTVPPAVTAVSTVGTGDSAVAGLAIALEGAETLIHACRLAVAMGTAAVLTPSTMLARRADVERILPLVRTEKLS